MAKISDLEQELKGRAYESEQLRSELHKLDADLNRVNLVVNQAPQQQHEQSRAPGASTSMTASLRTSLVPALPDLRADRHQAKELQRLEAKLDVLVGSLSLTVEQLAAGGIAANSKAADTSSAHDLSWEVQWSNGSGWWSPLPAMQAIRLSAGYLSQHTDTLDLDDSSPDVSHVHVDLCTMTISKRVNYRDEQGRIRCLLNRQVLEPLSKPQSPAAASAARTTMQLLEMALQTQTAAQMAEMRRTQAHAEEISRLAEERVEVLVAKALREDRARREEAEELVLLAAQEQAEAEAVAMHAAEANADEIAREAAREDRKRRGVAAVQIQRWQRGRTARVLFATEKAKKVRTKFTLRGSYVSCRRS